MILGAGDLLIAPPNMLDSRFKESVIFLAHHDDSGSWGFVLNKELGSTTASLFSKVGIECALDIPLYWGGPISPGVIWMLHDASWRMPNTVFINEEWAMTSHTTMFDVLATQGQPKHWRLFAGLAAWGEDQLISELQGLHPWNQNHSWLLCTCPEPSWAFDQENSLLWRNSLSLSGQQAVSQWLA